MTTRPISNPATTEELRDGERAAAERRRLMMLHHRAKRLARRDPSGVLARNRNR